MWRTLTGPTGSGGTSRSAEEGPRHERERDQDPGHGEEEVATVTDAVPERVHPHGSTLAMRASAARVERSRRRRADDGATRRGAQCAVMDGMRMLWARAARAELASSQSGSLVLRTNELCASHSAVHEVHVSR